MKITLQIDAKPFAKLRKLQGEKNALEKKIKTLQDSLGLPSASEETQGEYIIANGNNDEIGKMTIYKRDAFMMPACYIRRIS